MPNMVDTTRNKFVLLYFKEADPEYEYEIFPARDIQGGSRCVLQKGSTVSVKIGKLRAQGIIIDSSDKKKNLENQLDQLMQQKRAKAKQNKIKPKKEYFLQERNHVEPETSQIPASNDKQTQTEEEYVNPKYSELLKTNETLKLKYAKAAAFLSNLENNMLQSISNCRNINVDLGVTSPTCNNLFEDNKENIDDYDGDALVQIGAKGTMIPKSVYHQVDWHSYTAATRLLLVTLFSREVLATHSLTGKRSHAFLNTDKVAKARLNPDIISDIVEIVSKKSRVSESWVRTAITTKCADEDKLHKKRMRGKGMDENDDGTTKNSNREC